MVQEMWRLLSTIIAVAALLWYRRCRRQRRGQALQDLVFNLLGDVRLREWQQDADEEHREDVRMAQYGML